MLGWSINLFRIRGIKISLHFSFLIFLAYKCWLGYGKAGMTGLWLGAAELLAFFTCVVLHELGHSFTAMRFGVHVRRILLMPIGGMAEFDRIPRRPSQELLITVAGPAVNFMLAGAFWIVTRLLGDGFLGLPGDSLWVDFFYTLLVWNIFVGFFNLIPAFPMDGGRILRACLALRLPYLRATYWAAAVAKIVTVAGALLILWYGDADDNYLVLGICIFIFLAGEAEYRAVKRQQEEAFWNQSILRRVAEERPSEPPLLKG
jgi:Zn-dependent protease